jgi:hypothetical protein
MIRLTHHGLQSAPAQGIDPKTGKPVGAYVASTIVTRIHDTSSDPLF